MGILQSASPQVDKPIYRGEAEAQRGDAVIVTCLVLHRLVVEQGFKVAVYAQVPLSIILGHTGVK